MNENWTDFERYVFNSLEKNSLDHQNIYQKLSTLEESKTRGWDIFGRFTTVIGAVAASLLANHFIGKL